AAESLEAGIGLRALVLRIGKTSLRVGLPDLQHAIRHRLAIAIEHPALDSDALARGIRRDQIIDEGVVPLILAARRQTIFEERTDGLRRRKALLNFPLHYFVSIGVALRPRSTMLKR